MQSIRLALAALGLCVVGAPAALAQQSTAFTDAMLLIAQPCIENPTIDVCTKADRDIIARAAQEPTLQPDNEQNVYRTMRSFITINIGVEMGKADGARSQRSCLQMEQAWMEASRIQPSYSPNRAAEMTSIRDSALAMVRKCREEFGAQSPWTPLPAG